MLYNVPYFSQFPSLYLFSSLSPDIEFYLALFGNFLCPFLTLPLFLDFLCPFSTLPPVFGAFWDFLSVLILFYSTPTRTYPFNLRPIPLFIHTVS